MKKTMHAQAHHGLTSDKQKYRENLESGQRDTLHTEEQFKLLQISLHKLWVSTKGKVETHL